MNLKYVLVFGHFYYKILHLAAGDDVTLEAPQSFFINSGTVRINLKLDQLAMEPPEYFIWELSYQEATRPQNEHIFIRNLTIWILDSDSE